MNDLFTVKANLMTCILEVPSSNSIRLQVTAIPSSPGFVCVGELQPHQHADCKYPALHNF